jgi:hypothetical protein
VEQFIKLLFDLGVDSWVAMTLTRGGNSCKKVKISFSCMVEKILHFTIHNHERISVNKESSCAAMLLSQLKAFLVRNS